LSQISLSFYSIDEIHVVPFSTKSTHTGLTNCGTRFRL